jgi:type I restriction enzyme R subunit
VGLTATPAAHTVALFGEPVFRYGVEQAIRDGYLVDYEAVLIKSKVRINGVFLKEGERVGKIDTETGEELFDDVEDERTFSAEDVEREITAPDSNRKIIEEVAKHAYAHEAQTERFPKILIFAVNDIPHASHADQLVRIFRMGRERESPKRFLGNFEGIFQSDGYAAYDHVGGPKMVHAACWAHAKG